LLSLSINKADVDFDVYELFNYLFMIILSLQAVNAAFVVVDS